MASRRLMTTTHLPTSIFQDVVMSLDQEAQEQAKKASTYESATPRTPYGSPRTARDLNAVKGDRHQERDKRQKELIVSQVLTDLDTTQISKMKIEFDKRGGEVTLIEFIQIVKDALMPSDGADVSSIVRKLSTLFDEIDINGDQKMSWEEFTSYIVKNGGNKETDQASAQHFEETELQREIPLDKVEKLRYFTDIERLVICDKNQVVKLYKPTTQRFHDDFTLVRELAGHTGAILNAEYVPQHHYLCTSSTDNTILLWDASSSFRLKSSISAGHPQLALLWHPTHELLFSSETTGAIHTWDLNTFQNRSELVGHTDMTMDMKIIPNTPLLASASLDTRIYLWDLNTCEITTQIKGHTKGVFSLSYSNRFKLLFSGSFDRDVFVWNPVIEGVLFRLKGHHTSLVGVECLEDTPYLVSADRDGIFKLWDIRTFDCVQTFTANSPIVGMGAFTIVPRTKRLVTGGKKLYAFDYHKPGIPWLSDNRPVSTVIYNNKSLTIFTVFGRDIKIWDASTGLLVQMFHNPVGDDITAACIDSRERKILLGTSDGRLCVLNYANGTMLRELTPHKAEVTAVVAVKRNVYLTTSADSHIWVHDELAPPKKLTITGSFLSPPTVVEPSNVSKDVVCAGYSPDLNLAITATLSSAVRVWDFDTTSMETQFKFHIAEVTHVMFLDPYPVAASCDTDGVLYLYALRPLFIKNHPICRIQNLDHNNKPCGIHAMAWHAATMSIFTGDGYGEIKQYTTAPLFEHLGILHPSISRSRTAPLAAGAGGSSSSGISQSHLVVPAIPGATPADPPSPSSTTPNLPEGSSSSTMAFHLSPPNPEAMAEFLPLERQWSAHTEAVTCLHVVADPPALFSGSRDRRVRAWGVDGSYYGTLRQSPEGGRWSLPINMKARDEVDTEQVKQVLEDLRKADETPVKPVNLDNGTATWVNKLKLERQESRMMVLPQLPTSMTGAQHGRMFQLTERR